MKRFVLNATVAVAALVAGPAIAADIPVKAPAPVVAGYNWAGWYVGVNAGYSWGKADFDNCAVQGGGAGSYFADSSRISVCANGSGNAKSNDFTGGGQIGRLWQGGPLPILGGNYVFGFEADFQYFKHDATRSIGPITYPNFAPTTYSLTQSAETDWLATFRYRSGVAYNNLLLYTTYGLAVTELKSSFTFTDTFPNPANGKTATGSGSDVWFGWAFGGGAEYGLTQNITIRAEYLYVQFKGMDFSSSNLAGGGATFPGEVFTQSTDLKAHIARGAINLRF